MTSLLCIVSVEIFKMHRSSFWSHNNILSQNLHELSFDSNGSGSWILRVCTHIHLLFANGFSHIEHFTLHSILEKNCKIKLIEIRKKLKSLCFNETVLLMIQINQWQTRWPTLRRIALLWFILIVNRIRKYFAA